MLTSKTAKEFAASASTCESSIEAKELFKTGMAELEKIFESSVRSSKLFMLAIFTAYDVYYNICTLYCALSIILTQHLQDIIYTTPTCI